MVEFEDAFEAEERIGRRAESEDSVDREDGADAASSSSSRERAVFRFIGDANGEEVRGGVLEFAALEWDEVLDEKGFALDSACLNSRTACIANEGIKDALSGTLLEERVGKAGNESDLEALP